MKFWINLLLLPIIFSTHNVSKNISENQFKQETNDIVEKAAYSTLNENKLISVKLSSEPYYKTDNFSTTFRYLGENHPVDYWVKEENVCVKIYDKHFKKHKELEAEVYCYKDYGSFTLYMMDEYEKVSEISIYTRLTEYGVFASAGSKTACDNQVMEFEYQQGVIPKEKLEDYVTSKGSTYNIQYFDSPDPKKTIVTGKVLWEDCLSNTHPAAGVEIAFRQLIQYDPVRFNYLKTYIDQDGNYRLEIDTCDFTKYPVELVLSAVTEYSSVCAFVAYMFPYRDTYEVPIKKGLLNEVTITCKYCDSFNKPLQVACGVHFAEEYVKNVGKCKPDSVCIQYPFNFFGLVSGSAFGHICLTEENFEVWDTIFHEYAHRIQEKLGVFSCLGKDHFFWRDYTGEYGKRDGVVLSFQEGLADAFAIIIGQYFSNELKDIINAGDLYLDSDGNLPDKNNPNPVHTKYYNLEEPDDGFIAQGEANEQTAALFFYDLWDIENNKKEPYDKVGLGDTGFWNLLKNSGHKTISDLVKYINDHSLIDSEKLGELLEFYHFAVTNISQTFDLNRGVLHWTNSGNTSGKFTGNHSTNSMGDEFLLEFYDANDEFIFSDTCYNTYYNIPVNKWQLILNQPGAYYKVRIGAKSNSGGFTTGAFYGQTHSIYKTVYGYVEFDVEDYDIASNGTNSTGEKTYYVDYCFATKAFWRSACMVENDKKEKFLCLNPGLDSNNLSYLILRTRSTFTSVTFDLVFKTNRSSLTGTTIEVYKYRGSYCFEAAEIDPFDIGMDMNTDRRYTFAIPMGGDADGFQIRITGYGYTALCIRNIIFEK